MPGQLSAPSSPLSRLSPLTLARIAVGFALIAALWLAAASARGALIALGAALAAVICGHAGRRLAGRRAQPAVEWGLAGAGVAAELLVYAGIAAGVSLHPGLATGIAGGALHGTFLATVGGAGATGAWSLAVAGLIVTLLVPMTDLCVHGAGEPGARLRLVGPPGDLRLAAACLAALLLGARAALLVVLLQGLAALAAAVTVAARAGRERERGPVRGYRGDGRLAVWIGRWVGGRVPPLPPLLVGLLVTGVLAALGLGHLPGLLLLTPAEAMLLAASASWHPHDGRADWLVPPLIQAAEYVFLAEAGFARHVWPALVFAVVAAAGLRHLDLAYRARGGLAAGVDRSGLGWEGRMIAVGALAAVGVAPLAFALLGSYLGYRLGRDWLIGWAYRRQAPAG